MAKREDTVEIGEPNDDHPRQDSTILFSLFNTKVLDQGVLGRALRLSFFRSSLHSLYHSRNQYGANLSQSWSEFLLAGALSFLAAEKV